MNDKNYNSVCDFADELVLYLYDEIGAREKAEFERHLSACSHCAEELADFSFASFAVKDWRDTEFLPLETPPFEIPFENKLANLTSEKKTGLFFAEWKRIFASFPLWAAGAAVVLIVVGLLTIAGNLVQPDLTAKKEGQKSEISSNSAQTKKVESPVTENRDEPTKNLAQSQNSSRKEFVRQENGAEEVLTKSAANHKSAVVKVSDISVKPQPRRQINGSITASETNQFNRQSRQSAPAAKRQAPTLNSFDEDEAEDGLRLAELFEQIEASK